MPYNYLYRGVSGPKAVNNLMKRKILNRIFTVLGVVVLVSVLLVAGCVAGIQIATIRPEIIDFQPSSFEERADTPFFYSIGEALKYADHIATVVPTLLTGKIDEIVIAPDNKMAAVTTDGKLLIVHADATGNRLVTTVNAYDKDPKPVGKSFFRGDLIQWSKDSKYVYLIKDEYSLVSG